MNFAICIAIRPTPELAPWISTVWPGCSAPLVTTALCMVASATGRVAASSKFMLEGARKQPAVIGQRVFGERRTARAHHVVADLDAPGVRPELGDFAGPFHAEHGADAAGRAMGVALGHAEIGAVEAAGVDLDQHLRALRRGLCDIGDFGAVGAVNIGFHGIFSFLVSDG